MSGDLQSIPLQSDSIMVTNDPDELFALSFTEKWGDGMPFIPPTDKRIEAMLQGTPRLPSDIVVAEVPPRHGMATVELVAINAVMAGCLPHHLPLVIAALEGISEQAYNGFGLGTTTGPVASFVLVNGPTRDSMEINYRAGCLGGATGRGSTTIGRAVQLCLRNIGGMRAGESSRTVWGSPARLGICFGEWEERSEWPSLAMRKGFTREQEVVTVHGSMGTHPLTDVSTSNDRELVYLIAKSIASPMGNIFVPLLTHGEVIICINPMWAARFCKTFPTVELFQECAYDSCWQPIEFFPKLNQGYLYENNRVDSKGRVHGLSSPDRIVPVIAGGLGNLHATILPSWGESEMQSKETVR